MSESVAMVLGTENDIDPGTQEASAGNIEVAEQNKEMSEEEKKKKEEEIWKKKEGNFLEFMNRGVDTSDDQPLVGTEPVGESELHKKIRIKMLEQLEKLRNSSMEDLMLPSSVGPNYEDLDEVLEALENIFTPHPYPL